MSGARRAAGSMTAMLLPRSRTCAAPAAAGGAGLRTAAARSRRPAATASTDVRGTGGTTQDWVKDYVGALVKTNRDGSIDTEKVKVGTKKEGGDKRGSYFVTGSKDERPDVDVFEDRLKDPIINPVQ